MRETLVNILGQMLANNIGQRLTPELATGFATTFHQAIIQVETQANDALPQVQTAERGASEQG